MNALPSDIFLMFGTYEMASGYSIRHTTHVMTRAQAETPDVFHGFRAHWVIIFGSYGDDWLREHVMPRLTASTSSLSVGPVIMHVPHHDLMYPNDGWKEPIKCAACDEMARLREENQQLRDILSS